MALTLATAPDAAQLQGGYDRGGKLESVDNVMSFPISIGSIRKLNAPELIGKAACGVDYR